MARKNNLRDPNSRKRMIGNNEVKPVMFGVKRKMVGSINGELVRDSYGNLIPYKQVGKLV